MKLRYIYYLLLLLIPFKFEAQEIIMNFPHFAGKSFDFIIFQGSEQKTVLQGIIPQGGKFILSIPDEYKPYNGMSRWLITGTKEGGGLDMYIPGKDFSVSCSSSQPKESNIYYSDNSNNYLNDKYKEQFEILKRYEIMLSAKSVFDKESKNYNIFLNELALQRSAYIDFQTKIQSDYIRQLIQTINITKGIDPNLLESDIDKARSISNYVSKILNWDYLYTSGYWYSIIKSWVDIHIGVLKNPQKFAMDFGKIINSIHSQEVYVDFVDKVIQFLKLNGDMEYYDSILPIVKH